jgi:hypothetical protein
VRGLIIPILICICTMASAICGWLIRRSRNSSGRDSATSFKWLMMSYISCRLSCPSADATDLPEVAFAVIPRCRAMASKLLLFEKPTRSCRNARPYQRNMAFGHEMQGD